MVMDINVTHPIATNVTLIQPGWSLWVPAIFGILGAIVGALASGFATYYILKLQIKTNQLEKQKQIYSELSGVAFLLNSLTFMFGQAAVLSTIPDSWPMIERSEKYWNKLVQVQNRLWEIIGLIEVSFDRSKDLDDWIKQIDQVMREFSELIKEPSGPLTPEQRAEWIKDMLHKVPDYIDKNIHPVILKLLNYLRNEIDKRY